jgi:hypothetical protein
MRRPPRASSASKRISSGEHDRIATIRVLVTGVPCLRAFQPPLLAKENYIDMGKLGVGFGEGFSSHPLK